MIAGRPVSPGLGKCDPLAVNIIADQAQVGETRDEKQGEARRGELDSQFVAKAECEHGARILGPFSCAVFTEKTRARVGDARRRPNGRG
jgi:hypothetical protein